MNTRRCHICDWAARDGAELPGWCPRCRARTVADVADLPELYRTLGALLEPGATGERQRVGGTRTPPVPYRLGIANLRGPATAGALPGADQHGALSIATVLAIVRQLVRDACDLPAEWHAGMPHVDSQVERDAKFLVVWLDRYAERAAADEILSVVTALQNTRRRAWQACGYTAYKIRLGPCPKQIEAGLDCGRELWIDPVEDHSVRCRDCGTLWDQKYFLWLRRHSGELV